MQMVTDYPLNMGHIVSSNLMHDSWANFIQFEVKVPQASIPDKSRLELGF